MPVLVVSLPHPMVDDGTIAQWRHNHPSRIVITDVEEYVPSDTGLFGNDRGTEIRTEFIPVGKVRDIVTQSEDTDVLIITEKPLRGKVTAEVKNLSFPNEKKLPDFISTMTGVNKKVAAACVRRYPNPASALAVARQASLLETGEKLRGLVDPSPGDTPPWDILDAVFSGDSEKAALETKKVIHVTRDAVGLFFQLSGFMRKTINARQENASPYFLNRYSKIKDVHGVVDDIVYFSDVVFNVPKRHREVVVAAFVGSVSSRCR